MKITIIYGQSHKGNTYKVTEMLVQKLNCKKEDITQHYINNIPNCVGCAKCIMTGEEFCPHFEYINPIVKSMDKANILIISTPNYCMGMSGQMKTFFDHLAYRWISHRPNGNIKQKIGVAISTAAGAGAKKVTKSIKSQLFWLSVGKIYQLPFIVKAYELNEAKEERLIKLKNRVEKLSIKISRNVEKVKPDIKNRIIFKIMAKMQKKQWMERARKKLLEKKWLDRLNFLMSIYKKPNATKLPVDKILRKT